MHVPDTTCTAYVRVHLMLVQLLLLLAGEGSSVVGLQGRPLAQLLFQLLHSNRKTDPL